MHSFLWHELFIFLKPKEEEHNAQPQRLMLSPRKKKILPIRAESSEPEPELEDLRPRRESRETWLRHIPLLAAILTCFLCIWVDETVLSIHLTVFCISTFLIAKFHQVLTKHLALIHLTRHKPSRRSSSALLLFVSLLLLLFYPFKGVVRIGISILFIFSVVDFLNLTTSPNVRLILLGLFSLAGTVAQVASVVSLVSFAGCAYAGLRLRKGGQLKLSDVILGLAAFPLLVAICLFLLYWVMLSINWFWMDMNIHSKFKMLEAFGENVSLGARELRKLESISLFRNMQYPLVIKPNVCTTDSRYVQKCDTYQCLSNYVEERLHDLNRGESSWVVQRYHPGVEIVVFYYRLPYMTHGFIKTLGIRNKAYENRRKGNLKADYFTSISHDNSSLKTPKLVRFFDQLATKINGYHGGRFDCVVDDLTLAKEGQGIYILEANIFPLGDIKEKISHNKYWHARIFKFTIMEIRTVLLQIWIGAANILGGYQANPWRFVWNMPRLIQRFIQCKNHEMLFGIP